MQKRDLVAILVSILCLAGLYGGLSVLVDHVANSDWPAHARFHVELGGLYILLITAVVAYLAWGPYRKDEKGALWSLTLLLPGLPLGVLTAILIVPEGSPGGFDVTLTWAVLIGAVSVLILAWKR